jgi:transposase
MAAPPRRYRSPVVSISSGRGNTSPPPSGKRVRPASLACVARSLDRRVALPLKLVEVSQRSGATGRRGTQLVMLARQVIAGHREFLTDAHDPDWLSDQLAPLRQQIRVLLEQCAAGRHTRTANFAAGLLEEYEALWTSCDVPDLGIDPTNNAAERAVRHAVLMRKLQGGTQSDHGSRWIERIQSVRETCRLQHRPPLAYLIDATTAAHLQLPAPSLVPT